MKTLTYYLVGFFMGPFRTASSTETIEEFKEWAKKHNFGPDENNVWRENNGTGRSYVVFESMDDEVAKELNYPELSEIRHRTVIVEG